ncbi:MAG: hypothetical protein IPK99_14115 [Flavobacteriales bacterium]|nr:hypothetical protein [Flavobacteriales bacterium]
MFTANALLAQTDGIYVSDAGIFQNGPWQILRCDLDGSNPVAFITTHLNWPQDIVFLEDSNRVLISNLGSGTITKYDATTGAYISDFATGISGPTRMSIGPDGLLYVLQWNGNGTVRRYALNGMYVGEFTTVGVPQSIGMDRDSSGNLYVSSYSGGLVRRFDSAGIDLGLFIATDLAGPTNIRFDGNGDLLVSDYDGGAVKRFNAAGIFQDVFVSGLAQVEGFALYPDGSFLLGNGGTHSVKHFDADGAFVADLVPSGTGGLLNPNAIVLRGVSTSGISEVVTQENTVRVHPTAGRRFRIEVAHPERIRSMGIYSLNGELVDRLTQQTWNAEGIAAATYVLTVAWKDGSKTSQRIEVVPLRTRSPGPARVSGEHRGEGPSLWRQMAFGQQRLVDPRTSTQTCKPYSGRVTSP